MMAARRGISLAEVLMIEARCETPEMLVKQDRFVKRYLANKLRENHINAETVPLDEINEVLGMLGCQPQQSAELAMDTLMHTLDYKYPAVSS